MNVYCASSLKISIVLVPVGELVWRLKGVGWVGYSIGSIIINWVSLTPYFIYTINILVQKQERKDAVNDIESKAKKND